MHLTAHLTAEEKRKVAETAVVLRSLRPASAPLQLTENAFNRGGKEKSRRDHKDFAPIASCLRASAVKFFHPVE